MKLNFTKSQITAIKDSPKGQVPKFMAGVYNTKQVASVGGKVGKVGGTIGYDKTKKKLFGSYNVNGKVKKSFGPQE